jgi:NitT/TauT family transport system substrate-binding protein
VDASFLVAPGNLLAAKAGLRELFSSYDEGILLITEGLATGDEYLRDHPDVVRRMMRGTVRALHAMRENRSEAIATVTRFTDVDAEQAEQVYDFALPGWTTNGTADPDALKQSIDIMKLAGEVTTPVEESQAFDLRYVREVAAELGVR